MGTYTADYRDRLGLCAGSDGTDKSPVIAECCNRQAGNHPAITDICASGTGTVGGSYRKKSGRDIKSLPLFLSPLNIDMCFLYFFDDRIDLI